MVLGMTYPPSTSELPLTHSTDGPAELADMVAAAAAASTALPSGHQLDVSIAPDDSFVVDQSGRPLGPRALRTRARILEATLSLLDQRTMRDLRVIDIARAIGSSPATFYQYFKDVNGVVLELSSEITEFTPEMIELIRGDWTGRAGHERGLRLANLVADSWDRYRSILRIRNNAANEGDPEFMAVRLKAMLPMVMAFAEVIEAAHSAADTTESESHEWVGGHTRPLSGAMFMWSSLEGMAIHLEIFEKRFGPMGEGRDAVIETMATVLQSTLTSTR